MRLRRHYFQHRATSGGESTGCIKLPTAYVVGKRELEINFLLSELAVNMLPLWMNWERSRTGKELQTEVNNSNLLSKNRAL